MKRHYINQFINEYCEMQDVDKDVLFSKSRDRYLVERRMILAFFLRRRTELTWQEIGNIMNRNHASIIHYNNKVEGFLDVYPHLQRMFKSTLDLFKSYKHLMGDKTDIYSQLLIDNDKLRHKLDTNEKLIKQLINIENHG
tara:strand:- start:704 stop:1123 length:420 start_codon:yes stop_codon:yes gene_type:complete